MKKLLCAMLTLAMILSLVPTVYAEETVTVADHVFHDFTSADVIHKWGSSWNDNVLYYTEEGAAGYPDSYKDKTITMTIDGTATTLYAKYVATADSAITRDNYDYSLKWDKIGKKAPGGAFRDSDETNGRIESHGKKWLYDDRLTIKLGRGSIGTKTVEFNPETMMQNNTPTVDITKYGYVNMWIYSSAVANSSVSVDLNFTRTLSGTLDDKCNYRANIIPDWMGWKLLSIPVSSFVAKKGDATYPTYVNNVAFTITQAEADKLPEGYYINLNKIWASSEKPAEAVISENEETLMFYEMDSANNAYKWGNSWNHNSGVFKDDEYCTDVTGHEKAGEYTYLFKVDTVNTYAAHNAALVWDRINDTDKYYNNPEALESHQRAVTRKILRSPRNLNAELVDLNDYDYINIRAKVENSTPDMTIVATGQKYYQKTADNGSSTNVEEDCGISATANLGANGWQIIKLPLKVTGTGIANRLIFEVKGATSDLVITIDSIWYSKAQNLSSRGTTYFDFTEGEDYGFKLYKQNYSGNFTSSAGIDKTTFAIPTYKWDMSYGVKTEKGEEVSRIYCAKNLDLSDYVNGYLNMWIYSSAATNNKYVTVLSAANTPRYTSGSFDKTKSADYRTAHTDSNLTIDWEGWKLVSFKLSTKSSDAKLPLAITPSYYGTSSTGETNIPEAGYYSDITQIQLQQGSYYTYYKEDNEGNKYADAQTLWIADVFATTELPTVGSIEWTLPEAIGVNGELIFSQHIVPGGIESYEITDGTNVVDKNAYTVENCGETVKINFVEPLEYGTTYTLKALIGNSVAGQINFTTEAAGELTYSAPVIKAFSTGVSVSAAIENKTASTAPACLIVAVYDNETGELLDVAVNEKVITSHTDTLEIKKAITVKNRETSNIKAFIWDGIDEMKPITDIAQYPEAQ